MVQAILEQQHSDTPMCQDWIEHSTDGGTLEEYLIDMPAGMMPEARVKQQQATAEKIQKLIDWNKEAN